MPSNVVTDKELDRSARPFDAYASGPSEVVADEPTAARWGGITGAFLVLMALVVFFCRLYLKREVVLGTTAASIALVVGLVGLLFHAAFEREVQFRRVYLFAGALTLVIGVFLSVLPQPNAVGDLFAPGFVFMLLGLLFLLAPLRHEADATWRGLTLALLGGAGACMALVGLVGGTISPAFLMPYGLLLAPLGLVYLASFVGARGAGDDFAYRVGRLIGYAGVLVFLIAAGRSLYEPLANWWRAAGAVPSDYLVSGGGLLLMVLGLLYGIVSLGLCSDWPLVVLTRREIAAFFFSPVAYFVLFAFAATAGWNFIQFIQQLYEFRTIPEPLVQMYLVSLWPVFSVVIGVPILTMRLLSEESRSGTLEVLLTAPVEESKIVLSKFLAALIMFLTILVPFGLLLLALRLIGGQPFDGRPLLAFLVGMTATGAGFVAIGLFFSALTRNQIVAAVMSFAAMAVMLILGIIKNRLFPSPDSVGATVLGHMSFLDVWIYTLEGKLNPSLLFFHISLAIVCLFLTVKLLEARKWR